MEYSETIVKSRMSCRNFAKKPVEEAKIEALRKFFCEEKPLVDGIVADLKFYNGNVYEKLGKSVGYHGYCIKAPAYAVLFSAEGEHYRENAGYLTQGLSLEMTELGLASCWQTINDAAAAKEALGDTSDLAVACVVAFGYRADGDDQKKAPKISLDALTDSKYFDNDLDTDMLYPELEDSLRAVAHAQSFLNRQPYRMIVDDEFVSLIGIKDAETNESDEHLNYGIAMFNFYAVMAAVRPNAPRWSFEAPDHDLRLPDGTVFVAKCRI